MVYLWKAQYWNKSLAVSKNWLALGGAVSKTQFQRIKKTENKKIQSTLW